MSEPTRRIVSEMDLIGRFADSYRQKFAVLISQMNQGDSRAAASGIRLCIESLDMLLANQSALAKALSELSQETDEERVFRVAA